MLIKLLLRSKKVTRKTHTQITLTKDKKISSNKMKKMKAINGVMRIFLIKWNMQHSINAKYLLVVNVGSIMNVHISINVLMENVLVLKTHFVKMSISVILLVVLNAKWMPKNQIKAYCMGSQLVKGLLNSKY